MNKPNYFKFFDGYIETFKSCETHKDRSTLLLAMFTYWETGEVPKIPPKLQDKWRFLYNSLKSSRRNAYAKLGEVIEKNEQETLEKSSNSSSNNKKNEIDIQSVKSNSYTQSGHVESTYRIKNTELKNKEVKSIINNSDRYSDGIEDTYTYPPTPYDEDWKEVKEEQEQEQQLKTLGTFKTPIDYQPSPSSFSPTPYDEDWKEIIEEQEQQLKALGTFNTSTSHKPSPSVVPDSNPGSSTTNNNRLPSVCNTATVGEASTGSQSSSSGPQHLSTSNEDTKRMSEEIYRRILRKYRIDGKPVSYTRVTAFEELGIEREPFYDAVRYLQETGRIFVEKATMPDGKTINSYTPLFDKTKQLAGKVVYENIDKVKARPYYVMLKYFDEHPYYYNPSWSIDEFLISNRDYIDTAYAALKKELSGKITDPKNTLMVMLWITIKQDDMIFTEIYKLVK